METTSWALVLLGLVVVIHRAAQILSMSVDHAMLGTVLRKRIREGDLERCRRLLEAAGGVAVAVAMRGALSAVDGLSPRQGELSVRGALDRAFHEAFHVQIQRVGRARASAIVGLVACLAGAYLATRVQPVPLQLLAVAAGALVMAVFVLVRAHRLLVEGPRLFATLLPDLVARIGNANGPSRAALLEPVGGASIASSTGRTGTRTGVIFLDVLAVGAETEHVVLDQDIIKIGADPRSHVALPHEEGVGRMHAVIERVGASANIIDLGSDAGTTMRGERVNKATLVHGDEVVIGSTRLRIGLGLPLGSPSSSTSSGTSSGGSSGGSPSGASLGAPPSLSPSLSLSPSPSQSSSSSAAPWAREGTTSDDADPRSWRGTLHLYGFDSRSPDLFYEIVLGLLRSSPEARGVRVAKLRCSGRPAFLVALHGPRSAIESARAVVERGAEARYAECTSAGADIAPDATHGRETAQGTRLHEELLAGRNVVLATALI